MTSLVISEIFPPQTGGSGRWLWEIYSRLPRAEYVIAASNVPGQVEFDTKHDLRVERLPLTLTEWGLRSWRGLIGYGNSFFRLRKLVKQHRPDRVHAARVLPEGVMAWCLKRWFGIPYVCFVHGEEITCTSESRELRWLARRVVAGADFLIANSRNTARIAEDLWQAKSDRVRVLHPGVDVEKFHPAPRDPAVRKQLGWNDRQVVLTVGRLQKRKGHDRLIEALPLIRQAIPNILYAIFGDGEERQTLVQLVRREGLSDHVQFLGELGDAELVAAYQQCDLFVLPNRQVGQDIEGFGMVLLEAQACGKPVIAGTSGGTAETMSIPETGIVIDCSLPAIIAQAITEWLVERRQLDNMGIEARRWVQDNFNWTYLSRRAADIFEQQGRRVRTTKTQPLVVHSGAS